MRREKLLKLFLGCLFILAISSLSFLPGYAQEVKKYGGTLKIISSGGLINLGAPSARSSGHDLVHQAPCLETLVRFDKQGIPVPWLATGWEYGSDYKSLTMTLRKGVKFHDGTDFNAKAAKYVLDVYRESPKAEMKSVSSIDVIDDYTIRLNFSSYDSQIMSAFGIRAGFMISAKAWEEKGEKGCLLNPVGTGPFKFVSYQKDVSLKYTKFDDYWQKGKPYVYDIEFIFIKDLTTGLMAFKGKEGNVLLNTDPLTASGLEKEGYKIAIHQISSSGIAGDSAHADSPFADVRVRKAVSYALDKDAICKAVGYGFIKPADQPASPRSWSYNPSVEGYPYDPEMAKKLLAESGYTDGFKTKLIFQTVMRSNDMFLAIRNYLGKVGIDAELQAQDSGLFQKTSNGGWNNGLISFGIPTGIGMDPGFAFRMRLGNQFVSVGKPQDFEDLRKKALAEPVFEKRQILYRDLMKLVIDTHCMYTPVELAVQLAAFSPEVHDTNLVDPITNLWTPEDAWLDK